MKYCDIILIYNKKSWLHRLIAFFTGTTHKPMKAAHVALYIGNGMMFEANFYGTYIKKLRNLTAPDIAVHIARIIPDLTPELTTALVDTAIANTQRPYSFAQLLLAAIQYLFKRRNVPDASKRAVICSEIIAEIYESIGLRLFDKPSWEVTPQDFFSSPKLKIIKLRGMSE